MKELIHNASSYVTRIANHRCRWNCECWCISMSQMKFSMLSAFKYLADAIVIFAVTFPSDAENHLTSLSRHSRLSLFVWIYSFSQKSIHNVTNYVFEITRSRCGCGDCWCWGVASARGWSHAQPNGKIDAKSFQTFGKCHRSFCGDLPIGGR